MDIFENYKRIADTVNEAAVKSGRSPEEVELIAVTKYVDMERIAMAIDAGARSVGENKVQEYLEKEEFFNSRGVNADIIGRLQTNKVKYIVGKVRYIQSLDRMALATEINRLAVKNNVVQEVLVEVNIGDEEQKGGIDVPMLNDFLYEAALLPGIHINGLMCVPPAVSQEEARPYFVKMKKLFDDIASKHIDNITMKQLSMGMSGDYVAAIQEGATMVRVGSAIFGARAYH